MVLGSRNRIFLGYIVNFILHHHRAYFENVTIFMSKRIQKKIRQKHTEMFPFTEEKKFLELLENTVGSCPYLDEDGDTTYNFISHVEERYILFSLKQEKHHVFCTTIFSLNHKTLKKHLSDDGFKLLKGSYKEVVERIITSQA